MITPLNHIEAQFATAIAVYGLNPSKIVADGKCRRFDCGEDKKGKRSAWYVLYGDGVPAGAFGNWKTGLSEKWCGKADQTLTLTERKEYRERIDKARRDAELARLQREAAAAKACTRIMATALDATEDHPYCIRKGIRPYGLKEFKDKRTLIVPIRDGSGSVTSAQFIKDDGTKRFKSHGRIQGCYYSFGGRPVDTVLLCEGFATGASLFAVTGHPVVVAFNAGNMEAVARVLRAKLPDIRVIVCADNDRFNAQGNVGVREASAAALAIAGYLAIPTFQSTDETHTDFNDLHQVEGALPVLSAITSALLITPDDGMDCVAMSAGRGANIVRADRTGESGSRAVKIRCGDEITPLPISWLWDGWLPAGKLTILAGAAGTGKTTLALGLAAALTAGGEWPDGNHCKTKGNILIWSSEDVPDDTLVPRLIASGADMSRCYFIDGITENGESMPFDPSKDILNLHRTVEKIGGVSMLIIDPIVSAVAGDMHRANDVRRSLQAVVDFAEVHQCAVIGITHFAKGGAGKAPQDRVIGSQAFGALARMVLVAAKEEDGGRRVLARAKSNIAPDDGGISYTLGFTTLEGDIEATYAVWGGVVEGTAREILGEVEHDENGDASLRNDLERMLIDTLSDAGGKMATKRLQSEIRDAGHSWDAAKRIKKSLGIEAVKLGMTGAWMWSLPSTIARSESEGSEGSSQNKTHSSLPSALQSKSAVFTQMLTAPISANDGVEITEEI